MDNLSLVDIWREMHPETVRYTWRRKSTLQQARLDFFLVSKDLIGDITNSFIGSAYRSDHSLVYIRLQFQNPIPRRTFWKFNNSYLKDAEYMNMMKRVKEAISILKSRYMLHCPTIEKTLILSQLINFN